MDTKQVADSIAYLTGRVDDISDMHASDFMYFSQWMAELDKKVKGFEATMLRLEKTNQFTDAIKAAIPPPVVQVQKLPKLKIALAIGVGVAVGIKVNEALNKPRKEQ